MSKLEHNVITLNIGGTLFTTLRATLLQEANSFFAKMLKTDIPLDFDASKQVFIDRDPACFGYILQYLRQVISARELFQSVPMHLRPQLCKDVLFYNLESLFDEAKRSLVTVGNSAVQVYRIYEQKMQFCLKMDGDIDVCRYWQNFVFLVTKATVNEVQIWNCITGKKHGVLQHASPVQQFAMNDTYLYTIEASKISCWEWHGSSTIQSVANTFKCKDICEVLENSNNMISCGYESAINFLEVVHTYRVCEYTPQLTCTTKERKTGSKATVLEHGTVLCDSKLFKYPSTLCDCKGVLQKNVNGLLRLANNNSEISHFDIKTCKTLNVKEVSMVTANHVVVVDYIDNVRQYVVLERNSQEALKRYKEKPLAIDEALVLLYCEDNCTAMIKMFQSGATLCEISNFVQEYKLKFII